MIPASITNLHERDLSGQTVVITGASRGIGRHIAEAFGHAGANLVLNALAPSDAMEECLAALKAGNVACEAIYGSVAQADTAEALVGKALSSFGRLDVLVNNAGIVRDAPLMLMADADWDNVVSTNLRGVFACARAAVRPMTQQRSGRIISISSISAISGRAGQCNYSASKAGIVGFTKSLARELGPYNILVNALLVGVINTSMTRKLTKPQRDDITRNIPLKRMGLPEEVAGPCLFLASRHATFVNGTTINVSGGGYV